MKLHVFGTKNAGDHHRVLNGRNGQTIFITRAIPILRDPVFKEFTFGHCPRRGVVRFPADPAGSRPYGKTIRSRDATH
jgi:hypothetical protein